MSGGKGKGENDKKSKCEKGKGKQGGVWAPAGDRRVSAGRVPDLSTYQMLVGRVPVPDSTQVQTSLAWRRDVGRRCV